MGHVLVTGANGYIARHVCLALKDAGIGCIGLDNLANSEDPGAFFIRNDIPFYMGGVAKRAVLDEIFSAHDIDAVMHFAGLIYVAESFERPFAYYKANVCDAQAFFRYVLDAGVKTLVFSSSAGVYGEAQEIPIPENHSKEPINPYGRSKLAAEWILNDLAGAYTGVSTGILRYFNVAGADPQGRAGQDSITAQHLIEVACEAAMGKRDGMAIFGTDYATRDGTCLRDYIHVHDLAVAHVETLQYIRDKQESLTLNCGYGRGFTVHEIVDTVKQVSGAAFDVREESRRPGDPAELVAANDTIRETLDWQPQFDDINEIVRSAYNWKADNA
jgi:UDP-glucose 4-epimerase